jgi:uncharacterized protein YqjF (DUF2071 family)
MAQRWNTLLFAHWRLPPESLRPLVPASLPLDLFDGSAWVSVTPFWLSRLRARGLPAVPWMSQFPELNVRTYVTLGGKAGVFFFSLDAGSALAVAGARLMYHLPYYRASMNVREGSDGAIFYHSSRTHRGARPADFDAHYRPTGAVFTAAAGTLDHWLTERYCLYAVDQRSDVYRAEIHHRPWPLQRAHAEIGLNTMAKAAGITLPADPPVLAFARRLDVVVWPPQRAHS